MRRLALFLLSFMTAGAETFYSSANFTADLAGRPDARPGTWGTAEAVTWTITFNPPAGCAVEITQVRGDLVAWARGKVEAGLAAGVLFGLSTTGPDGSARGDWLADSCFLYVQDAVGQEPRRAPFNEKLKVRLLDDHKLVAKVAVFLNETGRVIHIEPTFTLSYRWISPTGVRCLPDPPARATPPTPRRNKFAP